MRNRIAQPVDKSLREGLPDEESGLALAHISNTNAGISLVPAVAITISNTSYPTAGISLRYVPSLKTGILTWPDVPTEDTVAILPPSTKPTALIVRNLTDGSGALRYLPSVPPTLLTWPDVPTEDTYTPPPPPPPPQ